MSWNLSLTGTFSVSRIAWYTTSPTLRPKPSGFPRSSEMRTSGMVIAQSEQRFDGFDDEAVDRLGALAAGPANQGLHQLRMTGNGFEGDRIHDGLPSAEGDGGFAAERIHERGSRVPKPIAVAGLEHDVAHLVLFGDPQGALERAYRAACAVDHFE